MHHAQLSSSTGQLRRPVLTMHGTGDGMAFAANENRVKEIVETAYNKFFWGGDCHFIEETAGSLEIAKDVVAEVLANRVGRGLLSEDLAREKTWRGKSGCGSSA